VSTERLTVNQTATVPDPLMPTDAVNLRTLEDRAVTVVGRRFKGSTQVVSTINTETVITYPDAIVATGITWDASNNRWTITRAGWYDVKLTARILQPANATAVLYLYRNNTLEARGLQNIAAQQDLNLQIAEPIFCAVGDTVQDLGLGCIHHHGRLIQGQPFYHRPHGRMTIRPRKR
jgi:hypothetical protein